MDQIPSHFLNPPPKTLHARVFLNFTASPLQDFLLDSKSFSKPPPKTLHAKVFLNFTDSPLQEFLSRFQVIFPHITVWGSCFSLASRRGFRRLRRRLALRRLLFTHSTLIHWLTHTSHSLTFTHFHSLSLSFTHFHSLSLTFTHFHSLSLTFTHFHQEELRRACRWAAAGFRVAGAVHRASALPFCVAGAVHRASWRSCGTVAVAGPRLPFAWQAQYTELRRSGRRWPAAAFCLAGAVHRASALPFCVAGAVHRASWRSCGAVAAAGPRLPFAWQAQYTEPPHFPCAWQAQYIELSGGAVARWPPLARGCLLPGRRSTQSVGTSASALPFCVAGAVHRASWRSCGAVAAAGPRLPFAWQAQYIEPLHFPFAWQAQYTELSGGAAGPRLPFAWQAQCTEPPHFPFAWPAQYTELSGGAAARWQPLARGCLLPGSQPYTDTEPGVAGAIHRAPLLITTPHSSTSDRSTSHHNSSQLITSQLITVPLLTPHFSQLPYHITTSYHNSSQLITS